MFFEGENSPFSRCNIISDGELKVKKFLADFCPLHGAEKGASVFLKIEIQSFTDLK
jgi:hypothetical protein